MTTGYLWCSDLKPLICLVLDADPGSGVKCGSRFNATQSISLTCNVGLIALEALQGFWFRVKFRKK